jgi:FKBP-type peptidyl-prolyl cis-trans isomerase SlyD
MKIEQGKRVKLDYTLTDAGGNVIESSQQKGPLEFVVGGGQIPVPNLEEQLIGMEEGAEREGKLPIPVEDPPKMEQPTDSFPSDAGLKVGSFFEANYEGQPVILRVSDITKEKVTVEVLNYLTYKVKVLEVSG